MSEILANDVLGDCTAAGAFHVGGMLLANAGQPIPYTVQDVINFYSATTGYDPSQIQPDGSNPTDQGGDEQTVLKYWQSTGLIPHEHKISAWVAVNGGDQLEVKTALWLFENLYCGIGLPDKWVNPEPQGNGFTWDYAGRVDDNNGHCFVWTSYDASGVTIDTWGLKGKLTWTAVSHYFRKGADAELYTVLSPDILNRAVEKAPNGFWFSQLSADIAKLHTI
jgi:hypothetical protein